MRLTAAVVEWEGKIVPARKIEVSQGMGIDRHVEAVRKFSNAAPSQRLAQIPVSSCSRSVLIVRRSGGDQEPEPVAPAFIHAAALQRLRSADVGRTAKEAIRDPVEVLMTNDRRVEGGIASRLNGIEVRCKDVDTIVTQGQSRRGAFRKYLNERPQAGGDATKGIARVHNHRIKPRPCPGVVPGLIVSRRFVEAMPSGDIMREVRPVERIDLSGFLIERGCLQDVEGRDEIEEGRKRPRSSQVVAINILLKYDIVSARVRKFRSDHAVRVVPAKR